jgi:hypothetical protein
MSSSSPPWEVWALDKSFFNTLNDWTLKHPEDALDVVLDKVCIGIDNGMEFFNLVPDSPFPARSLILALAYLVQLGTVQFSTYLQCRHAKFSIVAEHKESQKRRPDFCAGNHWLGFPGDIYVSGWGRRPLLVESLG